MNSSLQKHKDVLVERRNRHRFKRNTVNFLIRYQRFYHRFDHPLHILDVVYILAGYILWREYLKPEIMEFVIVTWAIVRLFSWTTIWLYRQWYDKVGIFFDPKKAFIPGRFQIEEFIERFKLCQPVPADYVTYEHTSQDFQDIARLSEQEIGFTDPELSQDDRIELYRRWTASGLPTIMRIGPHIVAPDTEMLGVSIVLPLSERGVDRFYVSVKQQPRSAVATERGRMW